MGLTRALVRFGAGRPHVLVLEAPGGKRARWAVEGEVRRRAWPTAANPAEADLLVVAGPVGGRVEPCVERVWCQVPAPRVRVRPERAGDVAAALDDAARRLAEGGEPGPPTGHGDPGVEMPGGLPMAERAVDRDGLVLDQLHVPLGPLLPEWPAGLTVHTTLQGDVVQHARIEVSEDGGQDDPREPDRWMGESARRRVVARLDSLARLLAVAGWDDAAALARWSRDDVLANVSASHVVPRLRRLIRRVRGSRMLRWLTEGLGNLPPETARAHGVTGSTLLASRSDGDVRARWQTWLSTIEQALPDFEDTAPPGDGDPEYEDPGPLLAVLPGLLEGTELAGARLIVASLDPDVAALDPRVAAEVTGD